jgi:hypothetical protein
MNSLEVVMVTWILVGVFLWVGPDGTVSPLVQPARVGFETEVKCNDYKDSQIPQLDERVASGVELRGYVLECRKVEVTEPKAKAPVAPKELPVAPKKK